MAFQWHTDEDFDDWEQIEHELPHDLPEIESQSTEETVNSTFHLSLWLWYAAVFCIPVFLGGGYLIYASIGRYVATQEADEKEHIEQTFDLLKQANREQDADILRTLLSGRNLEWSGAQSYLLERDHFLNKGFLSWQAQNDPQIEGILLTADFLTAEVRASHTYTIGTEQIVLTQTHLFRRGADQWLYSPLEEAYWGETITQTVAPFTLVYPERDLEQVHAFAPLLQNQIMLYCKHIENDSCLSYPITLEFSTDVRQSLDIYAPLQAGRWTRGGERVIVLPSMGMLGYPADKTAALHLYEQYIIYILAAYHYDFYLVAESPISHALLNQQLRQLDLPPVLTETRPLHSTEMYSLAEMMKRWESVIDYPAAPDGTWAQQAQTMVLFLAEVSPKFDPFSAQNSLRNAAHNVTWLTEVTEIPLPELEAMWANHLRRAEFFAPDFVADTPDYLQASCQVDGVMSLYYYDFDQSQWLLERPLGDSAQFDISYLAYGNNGYVIEQQGVANQEEWHTVVGQPNAQEYLFDGQAFETPISFTGESSPDGRYWTATQPHPRFNFDETLLVDTQNCASENCSFQRVNGAPIWSPSGEATLYSSLNRLYLADGQAQNGERLERGFAPFWLSDTEFGYLAFTAPQYSDGILRAHTKLVLHDTAQSQTEHIVDYELFPPEPLVIGAEAQTDAVLGYALSDPHGAHLYLLTVHEPERADEGERDRFYQLSIFEPEIKQLKPLLTWHHFIQDIAISPDGRWLTLITDLPHTERYQSIQVYDLHHKVNTFEGTLAANDDLESWTISWSGDSQWFTFLESNQMFVHQAGTAQAAILASPFTSCTAVFLPSEQ